MKKTLLVSKLLILSICSIYLAGCSSHKNAEYHKEETTEQEIPVSKNHMGRAEVRLEISETEQKAEPEIICEDWSGYFKNQNGAAVLLLPDVNKYMVYNYDLAVTRRSPCSTFKIISSLIALENGVINPKNSVRTWNGEKYWNKTWNRDIDFYDAFKTSCIWYFREVTNDMGRELIQSELNGLQYGNCDITDWEGRLNTNNNNRALTGFWVESSLKISPKEQTEVMERIFGDKTAYQADTIKLLKQVMELPDTEIPDVRIYGKTGMGKANGILVDAWFTGFSESSGERIYFCVYLGQTEDPDVSSAKAKEIAINIITDYFN